MPSCGATDVALSCSSSGRLFVISKTQARRSSPRFQSKFAPEFRRSMVPKDEPIC